MSKPFDYAAEFGHTTFAVVGFGDGRGVDLVHGWPALTAKVLAEAEIDLTDEATAEEWQWSDETPSRPYSISFSFEDGALQILRLPTRRAANDVLAERNRQVYVEGWTPEHDDKHNTGEMARAAACYALSGGRLEEDEQDRMPLIAARYCWPWAWSWWKPKDRRRDLVRASALLIAEIERLDRAAARAVAP